MSPSKPLSDFSVNSLASTDYDLADCFVLVLEGMLIRYEAFIKRTGVYHKIAKILGRLS